MFPQCSLSTEPPLAAVEDFVIILLRQRIHGFFQVGT